MISNLHTHTHTRIYDNRRKWRPSFQCDYVISDLNGCFGNLDVILNRITPLRKMKNQEDRIIFLGNYYGGDQQSSQVINTLINLQSYYKDKVIVLMGKQEQLLLNAINGSDDDYYYWLKSYGANIVHSYLFEKDLKISPYSIDKNKFVAIMGEQHLNFIKSLPYYFIDKNYCFLHSSFDPNKKLIDNLNTNFVFDQTAARYVKKCVKLKQTPRFADDYTYITSENLNDKKPFIYSKYFMLNGNEIGRTFLIELNSMFLTSVRRGKSRIYKHNFKFYE